MVMTQATTMPLATPQRTAHARRAAPTPMMAPGDGVGGRDRDAQIGRAEQRDGAAGLGAEALHGRQPGDLRCPWSARCASRRTACPAPSPPGRRSPPRRARGSRPQHALAKQQHGDDAHGLLRVVAAMAQRIERGGDELQRAEVLSTTNGVRRTKIHDTTSTSSSASDEPDQGRHDDGASVFPSPDQTTAPSPAFADARADDAADQRVGAGRGDAEPPGDDVPGDRAGQRAEDHARVDHLRAR